jgi:SdrD B-like domain/Secretion system C-terminal sorting domain
MKANSTPVLYALIFKYTILIVVFFSAFSTTASGQISGTVFRDFNGNGIQDVSIPADPGIQGVTIKAYNSTDVLQATAITSADGSYSFSSAQISGGTAVRLEFTVAAGSSHLYASSAAQNYGSNVQFVTAPATNIKAAFNSPKDFITVNNTPIFVAKHWGNSAPDATTGANKNESALVMFAETNSGSTPPPKGIAKLREVGNTWGVAYHNQSKTVFAATFFRKFGGFGPGGQSAIYSIRAGADGDIGTGDDVIGIFVKLDDYFGANSTGPYAFATKPKGDSLLTSKVAYGDIEIAADGKTLFAVNLNDRKIYKIPLDALASTPAAGSITASTPIPGAPDCTGPLGVLRPFGLAVKNDDGKLYVSATCEGSGRLYVWGYNPVTNVWDANPIISFAIGNYPGSPCCWGGWVPAASYSPVTLAMGLDFDPSGNFLNLTYINRRVYTQGSRNMGNIVRFCFNGSAWVVESAGTSCSVNGYSSSNGQGPGGGEFYDDASIDGPEVSIMGAAVQIPGRNTFTATFDDPFTVYTSGILHLNNNTGTQVYKYLVHPFTFHSVDEFDGKKNNLGDIEYISEIPPIEIGNRVWSDTNANGIQDAGEAGMPGVEMELTDGSGTVIAAVATADDGTYYFSSAVGINTKGMVYGVNIQPNTNYTVRVKGIATASNNITGNAGLGSTDYFTQSNYFGNGQADWSDNDGVKVGVRYQVSITTGAYDQNNHSIDFGFRQFSVLPVKLVSFTAQAQGSQVALQWSVADQLNAGSYEMECSKDNLTYSSFTSVAANSNVSAVYNALHASPVTGINYYRLKIVDKNGIITYSDIRKVNFGRGGNITVYPNPAHGEVNINLTAGMLYKPATISVFTIEGKLVSAKRLTTAGQTETVDVSTMANGKYIIRIVTDNDVINKTIEVIR